MIQSMRRLLRLAGEYKAAMIFSVVCAISSVAAGIIPYFLVQRFVMAILSPSVELAELLALSAGVGASLIAKTLLFSVSTAKSHRAAYRILRNMRLQLANKLTRLPLGYVLERDSGIIKKVMENDVEELERFLAHNIPETVSSAIVPIFVLLYLAFVDWRMTLAMLIFVPLAVFFYALMKGLDKVKMQKYYQSVDEMNAVVVEYVNGMKEIKAFNQAAGSLSRFREAINQYRHYCLEWYKACWPFMSAYFVLIQAAIVAVLPIGLYFAVSGSLETSTLVLFLLISMSFASPLIKLTEFANSITLVVNAEQNVHAILTEKEMPSIPISNTLQSNSVEFHNVVFSYNGTVEVLKNISFAASEGQSTAIIGPSGSGKSTIAKLICRFWDVTGGEILIGGMNIREMEPEKLMDRVSFVFQDTFLFNLSIGDNIRVGKPDASDEEIIRAAKLARCHDFILNTPNGYDTLAGDAGSHLSGGERQRICIARAILKNAPVLVLDEATASVDPDSEEQIQEAIGELAKGKTLIVIAHRIRTIMGFDKIIVIQDGRICAAGNHKELLESSPQYQAIYRAYSYTENWTVGFGRETPC